MLIDSTINSFLLKNNNQVLVQYLLPKDLSVAFLAGYMKVIFVIIGCFILAGCIHDVPSQDVSSLSISEYPKIASWLAKKDALLASGNSYDLVMTAWVTPEEAQQFKKMNPHVIILAGLTINWVYDNPDWIQFLETVASAEEPHQLTDAMFLKDSQGKCAFGWASDEWGHQEIYAMDVTNPEWREFILRMYKTLLDQPQHDGVIIDMLMDTSWCPDALSTEEWVLYTQKILKEIRDMADERSKVVFVNAGRDFTDIDQYGAYIDGYVMENFLGEWGADYDTGLEAGNTSYIIVYAVDTDNTNKKNLKKMRLALTLSLLFDTTYFTYDFGPRDHGQAWWFPEYNVDMGMPIGEYYIKDNAYWREFEKGIVVSSPYSNTAVSFSEMYQDVTTGEVSTSFLVEKGDGRIFIKV
jgi:hypothetical protein